MNIIIPIGGKSERFVKAGINIKKPLIKVYEKPLISYLLDNLNIHDSDKIFIIYFNCNELKEYINKKYPNIICIEIFIQTKGATETVLLGLNTILELTNHKKTMIFDCDIFYTEDVVSKFRLSNFNCLFYTINTDKDPIYSYIELDNNKIINIEEKIKISNYANTGIYCFLNIYDLYKYSKIILDKFMFYENEQLLTKSNVLKEKAMLSLEQEKKDKSFFCASSHKTRFYENEPYMSFVIKEMLKNEIFIGIKLNQQFVFNLGTPLLLNKYIQNTNILLFDLDGTIVLTDHIYYNVWKEILIAYNLEINHTFYKNFISGKNDMTVINNLFSNQNVDTFSKQKNELFAKNIENIKLVNGAYDFIINMKKLGHKLGVVTNCNRENAEQILQFTGLNKFFDILIIANECTRPKPYPDPYITAIQFFNTTNNKTIIFEDSKTGLLSANGVNPKCIVGIETSYSKSELLNNFANITIKDFSNIDIDTILYYQNMNHNLIKQFISQSINLPIVDINIIYSKLKGGFICDVIPLQIILNKNSDEIEELECVIKINSNINNNLSLMAQKLDLYNNEFYFYDFINKDININTPKFYGIIKDNDFNSFGILMENLNYKNYTLNINLNEESVNVSLNIIDQIVILHSQFWGKPITNYYKELKKNTDNIFWSSFITEKWPEFKLRWQYILNDKQIEIGQYIVDNYSTIEKNLSDKNLTLIHGDIKSANMFFDQNKQPYFIDWQYIRYAKGVQDLVFFIIESFDIKKIKLYKLLFKEYYYNKILEHNIDYSKDNYDSDFINASYYFPFFVAIWFGTINNDELIDKNFPFFFIQKLFTFYII